jgi:hypothetical protein
VQAVVTVRAWRPLVAAEGDGSLRTADVGEVLIACGVGAAVAFAVGFALTIGLRWLALRLEVSLEWTAATRSPVGALAEFPARSLVDRRSRHARTKITLLRRVTDAAVVAIVVAAAHERLVGSRSASEGPASVPNPPEES